MRERIAILESSLRAFKDQYDSQVLVNSELQRKIEGLVSENGRLSAMRHQFEALQTTNQDLQQKVENLVAENSRLVSEKHQLERRLSGALKKEPEASA